MACSRTEPATFGANQQYLKLSLPEQLFREVYDEYWDLLYKIANKKANDHHDALDIVQDTFTYVWNNCETLGQLEPAKLRSYLITCLYYRILSFFRAKGLRNKHLHFFQEQQGAEWVQDGLPVTETEEELLAINLAIMAELDKMPERMKYFFLQNHFHHKSVQELAAEYLISEKTVSNQISIARKKLKDFARTYPATEWAPFILLLLSQE